MSAKPGSGSKAAAKLASATSVPEPKDINYAITPVMWNYKNGVRYQEHNFGPALTDLRLSLDTQMASTVEIDLEDADFTLLSNVLFANWAFNIEDVSSSSQRKFKTTRLTNSTDTAYLGDAADLEWVLGQRPIDFEIGDTFYRLCGIQTQQTTATLTFEDRAASLLRDKSGAKSWDRSKHTRAQFVAMLCREAGVDYFIPEIDVTQPVTIDKTTSGTSSQTVVTGRTISAAANLTVKGAPITPAQLRTANLICQLGDKLGANGDAVCAVLFDAIFESGLGTDFGSTSAYGGVLGGPKSQYANDLSSANAQITAAFKGNTDWTSAITLASQNPGNIALIGSQCTRAVPYDSQGISTQYERQQAPGGIQGVVQEAQAIYAAYGGPRTTGSARASSKTDYAFTRGQNEDSWDCIQRLASEVAWYAFVRQNRLWFVSGNYLFQQQSQLTCEVGKNGVRWIDVNLDMGARDQIAETVVDADTSLWTALPGMVVTVKNRGPASGKWFVAQVSSSPKDPTQNAQITLYKPVPKRAEPVNNSTATVSGGGSNGIGTAKAAYEAAKALSNKKLIYTEQSRVLRPLNQIPQGATMYDCSSSVSELLCLAGFALPNGAFFGDPAPVSGDFTPGQAGLVAGPGKQMTIWANSQHVFIEFNIPGIGHFQGNTVNPYGSGFGLFQWNTPATGGWGGPNPGSGAPAFAPVHYPGT